MISSAIVGALDTYRAVTTTTTGAPGTLPPIEGYGKLATGGVAGTSYVVTNLNSSGAGSLNGGIASNRNITFASTLFGTINAGHNINNISNLTIDGTTAAYPGITITNSSGNGMSVGGSSTNIIIIGLSFINCGNSSTEGDGFNAIEQASNIVVAHCTAYGNSDGNIDFGNDAHHCTIQYCIIGGNKGFVLNNSGGTLITAYNVSYHHNFTNTGINNAGNDGERFPFGHRNYGVAAPGTSPDADVRNNLIWDYGRDNASGSGHGSGFGYNFKANVVNNYYKTKSTVARPDGVKNNVDGTTSQVYSAGNVSGDGLNFNSGTYNNHSEFPVAAPYGITSELACDSANKILLYAGITQRTGGSRRADEAALLANINLTGCGSATTTTSTSSTSTTSTSSTTTAPGTRTNLIFEALFEGALPSSAPSIGTIPDPAQCCCETTPSCCSYAATIVTTHPRTGTKCYRAEVRASDPAVHGGWRSEIVPQYTGGDSGNRWYGFSVYFEAPVMGGNWQGSYGGHFIQWHPDNGTGSLSFGLWGSDGLWDMVVNWQGDETADHYYTGGTTPNSGTHTPIQAGVWHDIVMNVNWSTGLTRWWRNGVLQNSITVPWTSGPSRYLKFGMNRWGNGPGGAPTNTWIIYYDNLRVGNDNATFNDVAP